MPAMLHLFVHLKSLNRPSSCSWLLIIITPFRSRVHTFVKGTMLAFLILINVP
jgi:hypothetical protein